MTNRTQNWNKSELEQVLCDFCKRDQTKPLLVRPDGMQVVECAHCGLAYLNPRPKPEFVQRFYGRDYFSKAGTDLNVGYSDYFTEGHRKALIADAESRLQLFEPLCPVGGARTLEIGCATGEFSSLLKRQGARPLGLDLSEAAILEARKAYPGVDFQVGGIEKIQGTELFDAIFAFELIEHVTSPSSFFECVWSLLKPGGFFALSTPNLACGQQVGFEKWTGFNNSFEHLYFFSRQSLRNFGERCQFEEVQWFTGCGDGLPQPFTEPSAKAKIASTLDGLGLLNTARKMKRLIAPGQREPIYSPGGAKHNLFLVFRKSTRNSADAGRVT